MNVQRLTHLFVRMDGYASMPVPCKHMGQNSLTRLTRLALRDGARRMCVMQYAFETGATRKSNANAHSPRCSSGFLQERAFCQVAVPILGKERPLAQLRTVVYYLAYLALVVGSSLA